MRPRLSILTSLWNQPERIVRTLDSIPRRDDIEVLVWDDASTDESLAVVEKYKAAHPELNIKIFKNDENHGCAYTANRLHEAATGEYFHYLDCDDYLYTDEYNKALNMVDGEDVVYFNLKVNDGMVLALTPDSKMGLCSPISRFIRTDFAVGAKLREDRKADGDWFFNLEIMERNPKEKFTGITAYHYDFPREGSLYWRLSHGQLSE